MRTFPSKLQYVCSGAEAKNKLVLNAWETINLHCDFYQKVRLTQRDFGPQSLAAESWWQVQGHVQEGDEFSV